MNRRVWAGVLAGLLAATVLLTVGVGAYRAGQDDEAVTRVVTETSDGEVVRVVRDDGDFGRHWGPGPGFFLFPLLIIGAVVLFARGGRRHWHGYGPPFNNDPEARWRDWHDRLHGEPTTEAPTAPSPNPPDESSG